MSGFSEIDDISAFIAQQKASIQDDKCKFGRGSATNLNEPPSDSENSASTYDDKTNKIDKQVPLPQNVNKNVKKVLSDSNLKSKTDCTDLDPFQFFDSFNRKPSKSAIEKFNINNNPVPVERPGSSFSNSGRRLVNKENEMEQWVSDTFYSYFPSFNKDENDKKTTLSRARKLDYQEYLKNIPEITSKHQQHMKKYGNKKNVDNNNNNNNNFAPETFVTKAKEENNLNAPPKGSPRHRLIQDLKHVDLPTILNTDIIAQRNRLMAEEEAKRKMDYQQELIQQIEEKRKEVERLREKEKMEEEMLTRRLEQQLKTIELEEELEQEKMKSEKIRVVNEQNHIRRLQLLSKLENDHKLFNPYDEDRKTLSENGKEVYAHPSSKPKKDKIYRYFSNSAKQDNEKLNRFNSNTTPSVSEFDFEDSSSESVNRYQYCKNCRTDINQSFFLIQSKAKPTPKHVEECINCRKKTEKVCRMCKNQRKHLSNRNLCVYCEQNLELQADSNEHQHHHHQHQNHNNNNNNNNNNHNNSKNYEYSRKNRSIEVLEDPYIESPQSSRIGKNNNSNTYKIVDIQYLESDNEHELSVLNPVIVRNNYKKPYSINVDKESLFNPNKKVPEPKVAVNIRNGEVFVDNKISSGSGIDDDDTTITDDPDDKISKYVKHYDTLWMKRGNRKNNLVSQNSVHNKNNNRLPSLSPPKIYVSNRPDNLKSDAMKTMEKKWEIPAVRRTKLNNDSPRVLTQLGAIRKQLQLEQMQMDQTYTKDY